MNGVQFGTLLPDGRVINQRVISHADIQRCPHYILVPEHYREDGSCRCDEGHYNSKGDWVKDRAVDIVAADLALTYHAGQLDRMGKPYINHVLDVAEAVSDYGVDYRAAALLHDILEDTSMTAWKLGRKIPAGIIQTVVHLTRREDESYDDFIDRIATSGDVRAIRIKLADLRNNLAPERKQGSTPSLRQRYVRALDRLTPLEDIR